MSLPSISPSSASEDRLWARILDWAGGPPLTDGLVHTTKARVVEDFAAALDTPAIRTLFDELERADPDQYWSSGIARAQAFGVRDRAGIGMLSLAAAWESSGATEGALGIALHLSARATFGLGADSLDRLLRDSYSDAFSRGEQLHARHSAALSEYLDRQYEETQAFLDGATVNVFRGTSAAPDAAGRVTITLLPLSSFALERSVAVAFPMHRTIPADENHALIAAAAPAERILSTPVTGMASMFEQEVVVLGATQPGDQVELTVADAGERVH